MFSSRKIQYTLPFCESQKDKIPSKIKSAKKNCPKFILVFILQLINTSYAIWCSLKKKMIFFSIELKKLIWLKCFVFYCCRYFRSTVIGLILWQWHFSSKFYRQLFIETYSLIPVLYLKICLLVFHHHSPQWIRNFIKKEHTQLFPRYYGFVRKSSQILSETKVNFEQTICSFEHLVDFKLLNF